MGKKLDGENTENVAENDDSDSSSSDGIEALLRRAKKRNGK